MTAANLQRHWFAFLLMASAWVLFGLLALADARLGLYRHISARTRAHAIPVALSQLYHHHPHDYTARLGVALAFRAPETLGELLKRYSDPAHAGEEGTYYWTADDRGLGDFVTLAFRAYGPKPRSLARFWFLLLAASLILFQLAYRRHAATHFAPVFVLFGLLLYAHACPHYADIDLGDGTRWQEAFGLHESRTFEALAVLAWLHLALLAWRGGGRVAWLAALPQVAMLLFLYHARSSLGWMYLALFVLAGMRILTDRARCAVPLVVAGLLAASLVALQQYKRAVYHPAYFQERGSRCFWHNALMGSYHPRLRESLDIGIDDTKAIVLVLRELRDGWRDRVRLDRVRGRGTRRVPPRVAARPGEGARVLRMAQAVRPRVALVASRPASGGRCLRGPRELARDGPRARRGAGRHGMSALSARPRRPRASSRPAPTSARAARVQHDPRDGLLRRAADPRGVPRRVAARPRAASSC